MHYIIFSLIGVMTGLLMALFGIGGGAFIVPALDAAFLAVPNSTHPPFQLIVIGSLCTIVIGSLPRAVKVLTGNKAERSVANLLILSALPFILLASVAATQLADKVLRLGFSATIVLIGLWTLFGKNAAIQSSQTPLKPNTYKLISVGAISGISSALFGLGGATLLMPLLTMWVGLPIAICVDISILFVSVTSVVSLSTLSFAWVGIHGADSIDHTMLVLILILGVSAALTQTIAAGRLIKMKDGVRQRLLGCYLVSLGGWVILRSFS
jgi:uncharacterized protein